MGDLSWLLILSNFVALRPPLPSMSIYWCSLLYSSKSILFFGFHLTVKSMLYPFGTCFTAIAWFGRVVLRSWNELSFWDVSIRESRPVCFILVLPYICLWFLDIFMPLGLLLFELVGEMLAVCCPSLPTFVVSKLVVRCLRRSNCLLASCNLNYFSFIVSRFLVLSSNEFFCRKSSTGAVCTKGFVEK